MITPVDVIPKTAKKTSQGERLRHDIMEAVEGSIMQFEITGDYNNKTLANNARMAADDVMQWACLKELEKRGVKIRYYWRWLDNKRYPFIRIYSHKQEDGTFRVYGEITPEYIDKAVDYAIEQDKKERKAEEERRKQRERSR